MCKSELFVNIRHPKSQCSLNNLSKPRTTHQQRLHNSTPVWPIVTSFKTKHSCRNTGLESTEAKHIMTSDTHHNTFFNLINHLIRPSCTGLLSLKTFQIFTTFAACGRNEITSPRDWILADKYWALNADIWWHAFVRVWHNNTTREVPCSYGLALLLWSFFTWFSNSYKWES